jgi:hypothetical protein
MRNLTWIIKEVNYKIRFSWFPYLMLLLIWYWFHKLLPLAWPILLPWLLISIWAMDPSFFSSVPKYTYLVSSLHLPRLHHFFFLHLVWLNLWPLPFSLLCGLYSLISIPFFFLCPVAIIELWDGHLSGYIYSEAPPIHLTSLFCQLLANRKMSVLYCLDYIDFWPL